MFKVIEFNKDAKRIILSHSRIFEDEQKAEARKARRAQQAGKPAAAEETVPATTVEKTTLGDISALAALKEQMEKGGE